MSGRLKPKNNFAKPKQKLPAWVIQDVKVTRNEMPNTMQQYPFLVLVKFNDCWHPAGAFKTFDDAELCCTKYEEFKEKMK